ncbi:hypothetical protein ACHQM5_029043 [Ranunculus cassubicifolius]
MAETSEEDDTREWLKLSLGAANVSDSKSKSVLVRSKTYLCDFCRRTFLSPQALGGHQNGHKRERGAARGYHSQWMMTMMMFTPHSFMLDESTTVVWHRSQTTTG